MIYKDKAFTLRPFTIDDINDTYLSWFADADVTQFTSHGNMPYTQHDADVFWMGRLNAPHVFLTWAIEAITTTRDKVVVGEEISIGPFDKIAKGAEVQLPPKLGVTLIGTVSLQSIDAIHRHAEIAWMIGDKSYWGRGIATRAGRHVLSHAFDRLHLWRVYCGFVRSNVAMNRVAERLGMQQEGTLRQAFMTRDGTWDNILQYSILSDEYELSRTTIEVE